MLSNSIAEPMKNFVHQLNKILCIAPEKDICEVIKNVVYKFTALQGKGKMQVLTPSFLPFKILCDFSWLSRSDVFASVS